MMKALVVFYSLEGNIKQTAQLIAEFAGADLLQLHPVKEYPNKGVKKFLWGGKSALMGNKPKLQPYIFDADKYDTIIIGTPVWASTFTPPIRTFIEDNRAALDGKKLAAVISYMGGGAEKTLSKLRNFLEIDRFTEELVLTEPKSAPRTEVENKVRNFCLKLKAACGND